MRAQDEERRRIGRDLHDSTGQTLAALEIDLARLADAKTGLTPPERQRLEQCARLARQCSAEIRTASYLLHPPLLDELGLISTLGWLADGLRQRTEMEIRLELPESLTRLQPAEELTLFRVAQEALTNAHRHSQSSWVVIRLTAGAHEVRLEIEDAGRGVHGHGRPQSGSGALLGVGLAGMRERIRQLGGTFAVESSSGRHARDGRAAGASGGTGAEHGVKAAVLQVVAEGLETAQRLECVRSLDWQGYYCCEPQPAPRFADMLAAQCDSRTGLVAALDRSAALRVER